MRPTPSASSTSYSLSWFEASVHDIVNAMVRAVYGRDMTAVETAEMIDHLRDRGAPEEFHDCTGLDRLGANFSRVQN